MKNGLKILSFLLILLVAGSLRAETPKREFRGAWLHVIGQSQWVKKTPQQQRDYIIDQFDKLQDAGCNAVIFQVRPTADALYVSEYEPWSRFLTGKRGKAPSPLWDPMEFAIEEAHKRGLEFHAWLNPYRVTSGPDDQTTPDMDYASNPDRYFKYDGKIFFDPAYQENRDFICTVIGDIVNRYDVDAIHIDDYFYPYPGKVAFNSDSASYAKFGEGMDKGDWRRKNVDLLIQQINKTIKDAKPWVRFGVSPFGIWRNKKSDPRGSDTNGFQNYDGLYADVLLWAKNGWIDYLAPQLYWALDHKLASTKILAQWWNDNANGVDIYIGYDTRQTMTTADSKAGHADELDSKVKMMRALPNIGGVVWWHGYWVTENLNGVRDRLADNYQMTVALPPLYGDPNKKPQPVKNLRTSKSAEGVTLSWNAPKAGTSMSETDAVKFVVYEFLPGENPDDLDNAEAIIMITPGLDVVISERDSGDDIKGNTYVVTSLDRMNRESTPVKVRL